MATPLVLYDACVLFPPSLRDLLLRIAAAGIVRARWTDRILDETFDNVVAKRPDLDVSRLRRTRRLMCEAIPDCMVTGYEHLVESLVLPDPDDRHVLAAAIHCSARVIVTANMRDFPAEALTPHGVEALHPDEFLIGIIERAGGAVRQTVEEQAAALRNPPLDVDDLLDRLSRAGLPLSVVQMRQLRDSG